MVESVARAVLCDRWQVECVRLCSLRSAQAVPIAIVRCFVCQPASLSVSMATPQQIFDDLAQRFKLEAAVTKQIVDSGVTTLSEFRFYCQDDSELLASFFTPVESSLSNARLQRARLRQAWAAVCQAESAREDKGSAAAVSLDEEDLLPASQLSNIKEMFWRRYHLIMPPDNTPSDRWVSKAQRALTKRSMDVIDVWDVRSIFNQRTSTAKRRRVAGSMLFIAEQGDEDDATAGEQTWFTYLQQLRVYLYSLALPGAAAVDPAPTGKETPENSVEHVQVPLDVLLKYLYRCEKLALQLPERARLQHIQSLDRAERGEWAQRFANSSATLGQCVLAVYRERDAHWLAPALIVPGREMPPMPPTPRRVSAEASLNEDSQGGQLAKQFRDGTRLCEAYQHGRCPKQGESNCANGQHRCAMTFRTGRVCGARDHVGKHCKAHKRAR